jgi:hypothetical protein
MRPLVGLYQLLGLLNVATLVIMLGAALLVALVIRPRSERLAARLLTAAVALMLGVNVLQMLLSLAAPAFIARFEINTYRWLGALLSLVEALAMAGLGWALLLFNRRQRRTGGA